MAEPPPAPRPAPSTAKNPAANPMKKRLLRTWDTPKPAPAPLPAPAQTPAKQPSRPGPEKKKPSPSRNHSALARTTAQPPHSPQSTPAHPAVKRRRYPKLLSTDKNGNLVAHPLNLHAAKKSSPTTNAPAHTPARPSHAQREKPDPRRPAKPAVERAAPALTSSKKPLVRTAAQPSRQTGISNPGRATVPKSSPSKVPYVVQKPVRPRATQSKPLAMPMRAKQAVRAAPAVPPRFPGRDARRTSGPQRVKHVKHAPASGPRARPHPGPQVVPLLHRAPQLPPNDSTPKIQNPGKATPKALQSAPGPRQGSDPRLVAPRHGNAPGSRPQSTTGAPVVASQTARPSAAERANDEKVIQVGRRCGTVQYWRSSLQMPKTSGVKKSSAKKPTSAVKKGLRTPREEEISAASAIPGVRAVGRPLSAPRTGTSPVAGPKQEPLLAPAPAATQHVAQVAPRGSLGSWPRGPVPTNRGLVNPLATRTPLDTGQQHAFWRTATKLPSVSSDKARQKRLASGRRKVGEASGAPAVSRSSSEGLPNKSAPCSNTTSPKGGTQKAGAQVADDHTNAGHQRVVEPVGVGTAAANTQPTPPSSGSTNGVDAAGSGSAESRAGVTPQMVIDEEQTEMRRLHMTKDYEIRKLEAYAESRYHVKMNLRGRHKLENWLATSDDIAANSVLFLVLVLNLDRRLVSRSARDRQDALEDMDNEHLRMLEALMARTSTRDGHTNWAVLTANFKVDRIEP